jgi:hypothetical protein
LLGFFYFKVTTKKSVTFLILPASYCETLKKIFGRSI